jgi:peroxiredoxin Q/BCP
MEVFMISSGQNFPAFSLKNQDGKTRTLKDYAGHWLILYVYPKDDTPGCTLQGKSFTKHKAEFEAQGVQIVGVSADDVNSHKDFCNKYSFAIELLADPDAELLKAIGVGQSEFKGTLYWDRTTFLIDPQGTVKRLYQKVNPEGHEQSLLTDLKEIKKVAK